jgi:hypothetical protein
MCGRHRSGEHNEISKHLPDLYAGKSIHGRMTPIVQVQLNALQRRHDELAATLNHNSPLWVDEYLIWRNYPQYYDLEVDLEHNFKDLADRCPMCRRLIEAYRDDEDAMRISRERIEER